MLEAIKKQLHNMPPMRVLLIGYCCIILLGTLLLSLPIASKPPGGTAISDAFFTATSATCVTGLIRFDTYTHWTFFGQAVLLCMIQIGGIGFMTVVVTLISFTKRKIGLNTRFVMQNSIAAPQVGGIVRLTKMVLTGTALFEGTGAVLLSFYYCPRLGALEGIWFSVFHSISAFCNAGFDLMGKFSPFGSLTSLTNNWYVSSVIMLLIIIGGLGFTVWLDLQRSKFRFKHLGLHSKVVITVSLLLIVIGTVGIYILETHGSCFAGSTVPQKILKSLFQSVSPRTAGFNSVDLGTLTQSTQFLILGLMLIGGSTGSTAGGMKTTTFAVLLMSVHATFRKRRSTEIFGRRLEDSVMQTASCIFLSYILLFSVCGMIISFLEKLPLLQCLFETASAIGTVGLSIGITPSVGMISKLILALLMLFGRVGSVTILLAFSGEDGQNISKLPLGKIQIG